jgi:polyferredoxin
MPYYFPILTFLVFEAVAVALWLTHGAIFYLFNFSYIGLCVSVGVFLSVKKFKHARNVVQFAVGLYMLVFLHFFDEFENMQIEGFWYYLFSGVFQAAVIHYAVAKIAGPLFFGRGWCGYACWTAMPLDLLPFKSPRRPRKKTKIIPYILFAASFVFVGSLFLFRVVDMDAVMFWSFIIGNLLYYVTGVALAFRLKDNRAFCKYICPIIVFLKPASYFSIIRVKNDESRCVACGKCKKICPMDVDMTNNSRNRTNGSDCILCCTCIGGCPKKALRLSLR